MQRKRVKRFKQLMALLLCMAMVMTMLPLSSAGVHAEELAEEPGSETAGTVSDEIPAVSEAAGTVTDEIQGTAGKVAGDDTIVSYDFTKYDSTIINDNSGHGKAAVMRNYDKGGFKIVDANIFGRDVKALSLPGGSDGGYLEFPVGIIAGRDAVTISMWVRLKTDTGYQRIWDFGNGDTTSYMYLLSNGGNDNHKGYSNGITRSGWSKEEGVESGTDNDIAKNRWVLTTVTFDGKKTTLYANGKKIGSKDTSVSINDLGKLTKCYIGYGQFGDAPTNGEFADVAIYGHAISDDEAAALFDMKDSDYTAGDKASLNIERIDVSAVTDNFELPLKGENGSDIAWTSDNTDIISINGGIASVSRPSVGSASASVKLTAAIKYGQAQDTKDFTVTVLPKSSDYDMAKADIDAISFDDLDHVVSKLELPTEGAKYKSVITWRTSDEVHIKADGTVSRPETGEPDAVVILSADAVHGSASVSGSFTATVIAAKETTSIVSYDKVNIETRAGVSPSLPNFVRVYYSDGSSSKMAVTWPAKIAADKYETAGQSFDVEGALVGVVYDRIKAHVTVTDASEETRQLQAYGFSLNDTRLNDENTILNQNMSRDINYLKKLDNDRMLYNFRKTFGKDTKGAAPLGGWDEPTGLLRGHSTGHYLSALALAYASTSDDEIKTKLDYMVHELREMQKTSSGNAADFKTRGTDQSVWSTDPKTWGEGYLSAYSPDQFALLEQYVPYATIWAPYYTLHKLMAGLLDAYQYEGNTEALDAAKALGLWVYNRLAACTPEQRSKMWSMYIAGELGGMNESMAKLYEITGDDRYLTGAEFFNNTKFFDNLSKNVDDIAGRHANQHIPQIIGALEVYRATTLSGNADMYYYDVAKNFWDRVMRDYTYSIGGVGRGENFKEAGILAGNIESDRNCETCAAYNMMKLTKMLYSYDPDNAEYMDYYERALDNQIIASQDPNEKDSNDVTYMLPIGNGVEKTYSDDYNSFTCCHGTGMENHVKYQEAAYFKKDATLYVNLYMPASVNWDEKGVQISQDNAFPSEDSTFTVNALAGKTPADFNMKFRVPYWAVNGFTITVNGTEQVRNPEAGTYVELQGIKAGDVIKVHAVYGYHLCATPDKINNSEIASIMYGPFVLVAKTDNTDWKTLRLSESLSDSIKQDGSDIMKMTTNGLSFEPMYKAHHYSYSTYFKIMQTNDNANYYDAKYVNDTPKNGNVQLSTELVREGSTLTVTTAPKQGYKVMFVKANGTELKAVSENTYQVQNVNAAQNIEVRFVLINPPVPDPAQLDQAATPTTDFCSSWENLDGVNNKNNEPVRSKAGTGVGWGDWSQEAGSVHWIAYTWDTPVKLNTNKIYWYDDGGDTHVPAAVTFDYQDSEGNWKPAVIKTKIADALKTDQYNTIELADLTTTGLRMNLTIAAGKSATGVLRWKVSYISGGNTPSGNTPSGNTPSGNTPSGNASDDDINNKPADNTPSMNSAVSISGNSNLKVTLDGKATCSRTYTGWQILPKVVVKYAYSKNGRQKYKTLKLNNDYTVVYRNNINAGTAGLYIIGRGSYYGVSDLYKFTIVPGGVKKFRVSGIGNIAFSQSADVMQKSFESGVSVVDGDLQLVKDRDYTILYNGSSAFPISGDKKIDVTIKGKGNYVAAIAPKAKGSFYELSGETYDLSKATVTMKHPSKTYVYNGKMQRPPVSVMCGTVKLKNNRDYRIIYKNAINAGTATVMIVAASRKCVSSAQLQFAVRKKDISKCRLAGIGTIGYTGYSISGLNLKVTDGRHVLKEGKDYEVVYSGNTRDITTAAIRKAGDAPAVTIRAIGDNYSNGSRVLKKQFRIVKRK